MKRKFEEFEEPDNKQNNPEIQNEETFASFFEENINWMNDSEMNPMATLKAFYPIYFHGDSIDYEKMRADILIPYTKKSNNKAHELFKCLFKMPFKAIKSVNTDDLLHIESEFGAGITAHGVEESKGGMYNLLLMCISNQVRVPSNYWGALISGQPNISPLSHGPYYLIYSLPFASTSAIPRNNAYLSDIARILVPFPENKEILTCKLEEMVAVGLITPESKKMFTDKLVTYSELLVDLRAMAEVRETPEVSSYSFFNSTSSSALKTNDLDTPSILSPQRRT